MLTHQVMTGEEHQGLVRRSQAIYLEIGIKVYAMGSAIDNSQLDRFIFSPSSPEVPVL